MYVCVIKLFRHSFYVHVAVHVICVIRNLSEPLACGNIKIITFYLTVNKCSVGCVCVFLQ